MQTLCDMLKNKISFEMGKSLMRSIFSAEISKRICNAADINEAFINLQRYCMTKNNVSIPYKGQIYVMQDGRVVLVTMKN
jgi:hypothetical protein